MNSSFRMPKKDINLRFCRSLWNFMPESLLGTKWMETAQSSRLRIRLARIGRLQFLALASLALLWSVTECSYSQFTLIYVGQGYATNQQGGTAREIAIAEDSAYIANHEDGLRIFNVSDPAHPREVWHYQNPYPVGAYSYGVCVSGRYAYLANGFDGLRIFDITDPEKAVNIGHTYPGGFALGVTVSGNYAYLPSSEGGLYILDISNPTNPVPVAQTNNGGNAYTVALSGPYAYLANNDDGLRVYDVTNPGMPINIGHINIGPPSSAGAVAVKVSGHYAYVAQGGLQIYDVSDPGMPTWTNGVSFGTSATSVAVSDNGSYAFLGCGPGGLYMCDVSSPSNIRVVSAGYDSEFVYGVVLHNNYVYVADGLRGMRVYLAMPQLAVALTSTNSLLVSWPQPLASGFRLQQNSDLSTTNWVDVTDVPTVASNQCQIVISPNGTRGFYRLSFPKSTNGA